MVTIKRDIVNPGHGYLAPWMLAVHSTANPGATARNHRDLWSRGYDFAVHLTSDWTEAYQCVEFNRLCWQVGNGNNTCIGIEICEATNAADFARGFEIAAQVCAQTLLARGWNISVMHPHLWFGQVYGGSDHVDPRPYFARFGRTWDDFANLTQQYLNGGGIMAISNADANKIAKAVWEYGVHGVKATDRLAGIDSAANKVKNLLVDHDEWKWLTNRVYRLADMFFNRTDAAGSGMADEHGKEVKRSMYDRIVWIDKRVRELNPYKTGEPKSLPVGVALTDEQIDKIATIVAAKLKETE
ncbi:peptidoglycan recognition protein family protein [Bifidobacterium pseudolongum]|uniref:peptidoglycan recognition protein family protein n=1 Tax=Bifidobacterium pseudolongum TaxID=1694 RepID=UPI001F118B2B|nr:N-acetylmuramoyl-L-alanine amidase [Bifidobacterium pseudolongum]MCH4856993.1 N-acetylmuramoyl-L-alanine amidase [Bifidobacterium pseudolongum]